jgi:hypothetical protein
MNLQKAFAIMMALVIAVFVVFFDPSSGQTDTANARKSDRTKNISDEAHTTRQDSLVQVYVNRFLLKRDLDSGLVAYWSLDEGSGDTAHDYSGNNNHGTIYGATWVDGISGEALQFHGVATHDRIIVPDNSSLDLVGDFSLSVWLKNPAGGVDYQIVITKTRTPFVDAYANYYLGLLGPGSYRADFIIGDGNTRCRLLSNAVFGTGTWYHIVAVRSQDSLKIFVQGVQDASGPRTVSQVANDSSLFIGGWNTSLFFTGILDEVRIYNRALSKAEIEYLYDNSVFNTFITSGPSEDEHLDSTAVTFIWSGIDDNTPVESLLYSYKMDENEWSTFARDTSHSFTNLVESYHTFQVRAMDKDSNVDLTPAIRHFAVDLTPPNTVLLSGPSDSSWITTPFVTFVWSGTDNLCPIKDLLYAYKTDSDTFCSFRSDTSDTFTNLTEGFHTFVCKVKDKAGHVDPTPLTTHFWVKFVDLQPTEIVVPDSAHCNRLIEVSWSVSIYGNGLVAGTWKDKIYLSNDSLVGSDTLLSEKVLSDSLHSGESYSVTDTFLIPDNLTGDYWVILQVDGENNIYEQGNEGNNTLIANHRTHLSIPSHPDLQITNLEVPPDGWTGLATDVRWTVANFGDTAVGVSWTEKVYLSTDSLIGSDILASTFVYSEGLGVGESYTHIHPVPLPEDAPGRYWVVVQTDALNNVGEYEGENNNFRISDSSITSHQSPYPDLRVTLVEGPPAAVSGQTINVSWTINNNGTDATDAPIWYDRLYLSRDTLIGPDDIILGTFRNFSYLAPGQSYLQTKAITLPWGIFTDDYHFIVFTDWNNWVNEHTAEGNNKGYSSPTTHISFVPPPAPKVSIFNVVAPSTGWPVSPPVQVSWDYANTGNLSTTTGAFRLHLCTSEHLSSSIASFGPFGTTGLPFNVGDTLSTNAEISIPWYASGSYYIGIVTFGWSGNTVPDTAWDSITINQLPSSDLMVTSVSSQADTLNAGSRTTVQWFVYNNGLGPALPTTWHDAIWLSTDISLDTTTDLLIGAFAHTEYLEPGDSSLRSQEIRIPQTISGQYYIFVCADYEDTVDEGSWENNNCNYRASPIQVLLFPPDLQVSSVSPTSTAWSEQSVWVKWTVTNTGVGHTPDVPWTDKIYLSNDNSLNIDVDSLIGNRTHSQVLDVDSSYSDSVSFTFAKGSYGTRYLFAVADANDTIYESNQGNNIHSQSFDVHLSPPPDLKVTQLLAPDTAFSREVITVQWVVTNNGSGRTRVSSWKDKVYLSTNSSPNVSGDTVLYTFVRNDTLKVGGSYMQSRDITIPSGWNGLFYLKVFTDATDTVYEYVSENNNVTVAPIYLKIPGLGDLPDLVVSNFQAPGQITAGDTCTVSWTVTNIGEHPTSMSANYWLDAVYFSNDNVLDVNSDINAFQLDHSQNLKPDSSYTVTETITCPDGVSGQHYLFLATDFTNRVSEASDSNNSASVSANFSLFPPDLYVTSIAVQDSADCGQPINIGWTVINQGIGPTRVSKWYDGVYLSKDQILDPTDYNLGSWKRQSVLRADSSYTTNLTATIPSGLAGPYYVMIKTDKNNNVYEHNNENNNYRRTPDAIQIILPPPVNLRVINITIPDSCFPGEPVEITWSVANTETSDVKGQWTDAVYVSADMVWDYYDDPVVGTATLTGTLKAGASYTKSVVFDIGDFFPGNLKADFSGNLEADLPGVVPGSYRAFVRTDILNNINETDESDNQNFSNDSIIVDVRDLAVWVPDSSTISTGQRKYYKIIPGAGYDLRLSLDIAPSGSPEVEFFVRHGEVPDRIHYDYHSYQTLNPHQVIKIPNTQTGTYYVLVSGIHTPSPSSSYTLLANLIPFSIEAVSPTAIGDSGQVTLKLYGGGFEDGATVALVGSDTVYATEVTIEDRILAKARFDLDMAEHGLYDVVLVNPGSDSAISQQGVTIESVRWGDIEVKTYGNHEVRPGTELTIFSQVINHNNVDIPYMTLILSSAADPATINIQVETYRQYSYPSSSDSTGAPTSFPGEDFMFTGVTIRDLTPLDTAEFSSKIKSGIDDWIPCGFSVVYDVTRAQYIARFLWAAEQLRWIILNNDSIVVEGEVEAAIADERSWLLGMFNAGIELRLFESSDTSYFHLYNLAPPDIPITKSSNKSLKSEHCPGPEGYMECVFWIEIEILLSKVHFKKFTEAFLWGHAIERCIEIVKEEASEECNYEKVCISEGGEPKIGEKIAYLPAYSGRWGHVYEYETYECIRSAYSRDPNEKAGPTGSRGDNLVPVTAVLPYTIYFENTPDATAPAVNVTVTDQLNSNLDWRTFRLNEFSFGDTVIEVPSNRSYWHTSVALDTLNQIVDIDAGINAYTGELHWTFETIDANTGQPVVDPDLGFLPPNDSTGRGEGHVSYTVKAKQDSPDGTEIRNSALIVFDINDPIQTNEVVNVTYTPWPDLVVSSASVQSGSSYLIVGQPATLKATVQNQGLVDCDSFFVELFLGTPNRTGFEDSTLEGWVADPSILVDITDQNNHSGRFSCIIHGRPLSDPPMPRGSITKYLSGSDINTNKPFTFSAWFYYDLPFGGQDQVEIQYTIDYASGDSSFTEVISDSVGEQWTLSQFEIHLEHFDDVIGISTKIIGSSAPFNDLYCDDICLGGVLIGDTLIDMLRASQSKEVDFTWIPTNPMENAVLYFYADYENAVHEMNDENNFRTLTVTVGYGWSPGCPFVYTWTGKEFEQDNTILAASELKNRKVKDITDYYLLKKPLVVKDNKYRLQIREFEQERSYLDNFELLAVDHTAETKVGVTPDGHIFTYKDEISPVSCVDHNGQDQLATILNEDKSYYNCKGPGYLTLTFGPFAGLPPGALLAPAPPPPCLKKPIAGSPDTPLNATLEVRDADGNWIKVLDLPARENPDLTFSFLDQKYLDSEGKVTLRISWEDHYSADRIGFFVVSDEQPAIEKYSLISAIHSAKGEVSTLLSSTDQSYVTLTPNENIELVFSREEENVNEIEGLSRDFVLKSQGFYVKLGEESSEASVIPKEFTLFPNYPNPFNPQTVIQYALPHDCEVQITIYNILGQKVRTLVNENQKAGYQRVEWNSKNDKGEEVASGIYFFRIKAGEFSDVRKMVLLK